MKIYKYLLMLPLALMAVSCSDENKEMIAEESSNNGLKSIYLPRSSNELWEPGETIRYYFMGDGTEEQKQWVRDCMEEIMTHANINFEEVKRQSISHYSINIDNHSSSFPIEFKRCTFVMGKRERAICILGECGTSNIYVQEIKRRFAIAPQPARQMLIQAYFKSLVLHDICHVLGFGDEIHNPNAHISFNKANMIAWLKKQGKNVDDNYANDVYDEEFGEEFLRNYTKCNYTAFDSKSIMMTPILSEWTTNGKSYSSNYVLSDIDKQKLKELYPYGNHVKLYVGSVNGSDGVIGTKDFFEDQSKIRGFIGFGFDKTRDRYQNDTTQLLSCKKMESDEVRQGLLTYIPGAYPFGVNNGIVELTNETGWGSYSNKLWGPYVFAREGDGRIPIITYYNNSTKRYAVSYANDEYLIKKGYQAKGCIGAVKSDSKLK